MLDPISLSALILAGGGFLFSIKGQRNKVNDDFIKSMESKNGALEVRVSELEIKVADCEKDRQLLKDHIAALTRPSKILFVDDDDSARILFEKHTSNFNRTITAAPNGRTALELFEADNYDLILLDIKLPDMSGIEVFQKMKLSNRKSRIVFMSGVYTPEEIKEAG